MSARGFWGFLWKLLADASAIIHRSSRRQPGSHPLATEFLVFICEHCGRHGEAPREGGDEWSRDEGGFRICGECLERMCGLKQGTPGPPEGPDKIPPREFGESLG